jgi:hypothetical protein
MHSQLPFWQRAADHRRDVRRELERRVGVALHLRLTATLLPCGHGQRIGYADVLGVSEAHSTLGVQISSAGQPTPERQASLC